MIDEMAMDIQRLRNLTTDKLHTQISDICEDIEFLVGEKGIMTHMLPNACKALKRVYLLSQIKDERFWDGQYDTNHRGDYPINPMPPEIKQSFWGYYSQLHSPLSFWDFHRQLQ